MAIKFSEDLVPLTDLKVNPGRVVRHVNDVHRPVLLTSRGRAVAVIQSVADYEKAEEERDFMRAVLAEDLPSASYHGCPAPMITSTALS